MAQLETGLSPNHRFTAAEYKRIGYLANGWNAIRRWNGRTAALQTAGIEGPDVNTEWVPYPQSSEGTGALASKHTFRSYRYRYKDSSTGNVSNPSQATTHMVADPNYILFSDYNDNLSFGIGAPTSVLGPHATGLAITARTITRDSGSWITDGFARGDYIVLDDCEDSANDGTWGPIVGITATVLTLAGGQALTSNSDDTTATWQRSSKGRMQPSSDAKVDKIVLEATTEIYQVEVDTDYDLAGPDTTGLVIDDVSLTRSTGSWITDGFQVGGYIQLAYLESKQSSLGADRHELYGPIVSLTDTTLTILGAQWASNAADTAAMWRPWKVVEVGDPDTFFVVGEIDNTEANWNENIMNVTDTYLETQLLPYPDGFVHFPPPICKNVLSHRERLWFYGQVDHAVGNCDVTNSSLYVGEGATDPDWNTEVLGSASGEANVQWLFQRDGDEEVYEIDYYDSANSRIVLKKAYEGTTGTDVSYKIFSQSNVIWVSEPGYPESFDLATFLNGPNAESSGDITAAIGYGASVIFFSKSGMTRFGFATDPYTDGAFVPLSNKAGALSQRVVLEVEGIVYTMDQRGWHRWAGTFPEKIDRPLGPILPLIDMSKADYFHACYLPDSRAIRWWVSYTGDTYPKNYVQFDIDTGAWSTGSYLQGITESRLIQQGDGLKLFLLDENGHSWWGDTGVADGCPAANTHLTAAAGVSGTSVPVDETLPTTGVGLAGCFLTRRTAAGAAESRRIASNTADTITLASAFSANPADGDELWVGSIPSKLKTRAYMSRDLAGKVKTGHLTIVYNPTSSARYLQVRIYENLSDTAKTWAAARNNRTGVTWPGGNARYPTADWLVDLSNSDGVVTLPIGAEWKRSFEVELEIVEPDADFHLLAIDVDGEALREAGL